MCRLNTSGQRKGGQGVRNPPAESYTWLNPPLPPSSHHRVGGHMLCGTICAPAEHKHEWERAGFLINAHFFMLKRKEEEDADTRLALRQLSRAGTG